MLLTPNVPERANVRSVPSLMASTLAARFRAVVRWYLRMDLPVSMSQLSLMDTGTVVSLVCAAVAAAAGVFASTAYKHYETVPVVIKIRCISGVWFVVNEKEVINEVKKDHVCC